MSEDAQGADPNPTLDIAGSFATIRSGLAELDVAIDELRAEADRLLASACARQTFVGFAATAGSEPAFPEPDDIVGPTLVEVAPSESPAPEIDAVDAPDVPVGNDAADSAAPEAPGGGAVADSPVPNGAGQRRHPTAAAEPAFGPFGLPQTAAEAIAAAAPTAGTGVEPDVGGIDRGPQAVAATDVEGTVSAADHPQHGSARLRPIDGEGDDQRTFDAEPEAVLGGERETDPFESAASAATAAMAHEWTGPSEDDAAFERFFSDTIEPEPAQRWLLEG